MNVHELALASLNNHWLFTFLDLAGTFAFAISGSVAARKRGLDWFGVLACFVLRYLSLHYKWSLPRSPARETDGVD